MGQRGHAIDDPTGRTARGAAHCRRGSWTSVAAIVCLAAVVLVLAFRLRSLVGPLGVDTWVGRHLVARLPDGRGRSGDLYGWIAWVGAPGFVGAVTTFALLRAARRRDLAGGLLAVVGPGLAFVLAEVVLKPLVARRMHPKDLIFIFPSGTVAVVAAAAAATVILVKRWSGRARATMAAPVLGAIVLVVGVAVVEVGWHYATDVIGGLASRGSLPCSRSPRSLALFERKTAHGASPPTVSRG